MRRALMLICLVALGFGCVRDRMPEFPKFKEEQVSPPDGAYVGPMQYPREMLNQFPVREEKKEGLSRMPQGPGMNSMNRGMQ